MGKRAFTLVELIIVVAVLGIIASLVIPQVQGYTIRSKEAAAKDMIHTVRTQIEFYKFDHDGVAPGYENAVQASLSVLEQQFTGTSMLNGMASPNPVPGGPFIYGPYLQSIPTNPFNNLSNFNYVPDGSAFADAVDGTSSGWLYKKETAEFKLNWTGTDTEGVKYHEY